MGNRLNRRGPFGPFLRLQFILGNLSGETAEAVGETMEEEPISDEEIDLAKNVSPFQEIRIHKIEEVANQLKKRLHLISENSESVDLDIFLKLESQEREIQKLKEQINYFKKQIVKKSH